MASLFTKDMLPSSTEEAIRSFDERYLGAVMAADPGDWAQQFVFDTDSPRTTFPLSFVSTKYRETKEVTGRAETMESDSFDVSVVEFDAGYEASWLDLKTNSFAYRQWNQQASLFVMAERRHVSKELTALLELGTSVTSPWDNVAFFSASHRANRKANSTTFSNYQSSALDPAVIANITAEITSMKDVRDANGDRLGVQPDEIWLPPQKFQAVSNLLNQNFISDGTTTITNPYLGKLTPRELTDASDANDWYLVDSKLMGLLPPMVSMRYAAPEMALSFLDESSDHFKTTKKLKAMSHIFYGFGLVFPHAIRLVRGA
mgnify:CR=1 FL=1